MSQAQVTDNTKKMTEKQLVAVRAALMALGTMASRITGFLRDMLIASYFNRTVTDAFVVAFRLPNMFRRLLGEGSMAVSFIPVFVEQLARGEVDPRTGRTRAYEMACGMFTILLTFLLLLSALGVVFMSPILGWLVDGQGFQAIPGKFELAVFLGQIMFSFVFLVSLYAYFMALLQSLKVFALPALAPALFNLTIIIACLLPSSLFKISGEVLAWGVLVGGGVQLGLLIPKLHRLGYLPKLTWRWRTPALAQVFKAMGPGIIGMGVLQLMGLVNVKLASRLEEGSHSFIYFADRILELPLSLFAVSLGTALLPTLADCWARGEREEMGETANHYMRLVFFVSVPCALGLWFLGQPIAEVLFMRGKFTYEHAVTTGELVRLYAFTLLSASGVRVLAPAFYAIKNTWFPALSSVVALLFHIGLAMYLMPRYGLKGLVGSTVLSSFLNFGLLALATRFFIGRLYYSRLLVSIGRFLICGALLAMVLQFYQPFLLFISRLLFGVSAAVFLLDNGVVVQALRAGVLFIVIGLAAGVYFLSAKLLKVPEFQEVSSTFMRKLRRKR